MNNRVVRFKKPQSGDIYAVRPEHVVAVYGKQPLPNAKNPVHLECTLKLTNGDSLRVEGEFENVINKLWGDE